MVINKIILAYYRSDYEAGPPVIIPAYTQTCSQIAIKLDIFSLLKSILHTRDCSRMHLIISKGHQKGAIAGRLGGDVAELGEWGWPSGENLMMWQGEVVKGWAM